MKENIAITHTSKEFKFTGRIEVLSDGLPRGQFNATYTDQKGVSHQSVLPLSDEIMGLILYSSNYVQSESMIRSVADIFFQYDARMPPKGWNYRLTEKNNGHSFSEIDAIDSDGYLWRIKIESMKSGHYRFVAKKTKTEIMEMKKMQ